MTKQQFDILVALEQAQNGLSVQDLAAQTNLDLTCAEQVIEELIRRGLVCGGVITASGIAALQPYKTKRAVFIAAGYGSRLQPVTYSVAKPLVKVNGVRIIDTLIDGALAAGIQEIYVVCGYLADQFEQLKDKYPNINLVVNELYSVANNISSVLAVRNCLQNAYVCEADLLMHNQVFDKYVYHSCYLGIPTDATDDWYFKTNAQGTICELGIGATDCYRMLGISYWDQNDGSTLNEHVEATFKSTGGKDKDWCFVPLGNFMEHYKVHVRECKAEDIEEIDTYEELCAIDPSYKNWK